MRHKTGIAAGVVLAVTMGMVGLGLPAQATDTDGASTQRSSASAPTPSMGPAQTPVQSDGVEVGSRARGMTVRVSDPKDLGFLQVPCAVSQDCPDGTNLIVPMNDRVKFTGRVDDVAEGSRVVVQRASLSKRGNIGPWADVAWSQLDGRGRFTKKVFVPAGNFLFRVKFADQGAQSTQRAIGGTLSISGLPLMNVDFVNQMKQKDKYNLNLYVTTEVDPGSGCSTSTSSSNPCPVFTSSSFALNAAGKGATPSASQTLHFAYLLPVNGANSNANMTFGFYLQKQGCVGKCSTFLPNFSAGVHGTSCGKLSTPPSTYMTSGTQWTVYLQAQTTGYNAFLDGPGMPASKKSKDYPNGCVFAVQTEFDNDIATLGVVGWLKVTFVAIRDVMAVVKLLGSDGAVGKARTVLALERTLKMIHKVPHVPDWVDMGACKTLADDFALTAKNTDMFGGMVFYTDSSTQRTSIVYANAKCTVPSTIYGSALGLVQGKAI